MQVFPSRIGIGLGIALWGFILLIFYIINGERIVGDSLVLLVIEIIILMAMGTFWFGTRYVIKDGELIIKIGPFIHSSLDLENIQSISRSSSATSQPAPSLKRIRLSLIDSYPVLISPRREWDLIRALKEINPRIYNGMRQDPSPHWMIRAIDWFL